MPLPQVNDRLKEIPAQALRTVFATIGQLLLVADRLRAKAAGQLSGSGEAAPTRPADQAPAPAPPPPAKPAKPAKPARPARPARPDAENSRWRSLDKTGNVRVLDGGEEQDDEDVPRVTKAVPEPAPAPVPSAEYTPTEVVPAVSVPAEPAPAEPAPAEAEPAMQQEARPIMQQEAEPAPAEVTAEEPFPAEPAPAEPAQAEPAVQQETEPAQAEPAVQQETKPAQAEPAMQQEAEPAQPAAASEVLPVPNYDQLSVASLRARLRVLDAGQVQALLDYEKVHESRPAVITMFEHRLTKLGEGN